MRDLASYVERVANADPENAAIIVSSAGLSIKRTPGGPRRAFVVKHGPVSGSLRARVPRLDPRACYEWAVSEDGGATWRQLATTVRARTAIDGLRPGSTVHLRYRVVSASGTGEWSQSYPIIVL